MSGLTYLIQANIYLILFMGFYALVLKNETFFRHNRIYLNASVILSFAIPFLNTSWFNDFFITEKVRDVTQAPVQMMYDMVIVVANEENSWTMADTLFWTYIGVAGILFIRLIAQLLLLRKQLKLASGGAFSFFNILVIDSALAHNDTIITHEKVHMKEWHSADVLLSELVSIIVWFNPVIYLYKTEIRHIHEFIADEEASSAMSSKSEYAELLFSTTMGIEPNQLSNNFFNHSLLKRRVMMLYRSKSTRTALWKYGFSAPLFAGMLIFSAATARTGEPNLVEEVGNLVAPIIQDRAPKNVINNASSERNDSSIQQKDKASIETPQTDTTEKVKFYQMNEVLISANQTENVSDINVFKKFLQLNIKYPQSARDQRTTGLVVTRFTVENNKIVSADIESTQSAVLSAEVLKVMKSYSGELNLPADSYTLDFVFHLQGMDIAIIDKIKRNEMPNHKGSIMVVGYVGENKTERVATSRDVRDFSDVERLPQFEGGTIGWANYLRKNLKYPEAARKNKREGRVILSFVVEKDGNLSEIKVLRGLGDGLDEEALRVLKSSPKWEPGLEDGEKVRVAYTMPIFFKLENPSEETKNN